MAVMLISSEVEEILGLARRALVMRRGAIVSEPARGADDGGGDACRLHRNSRRATGRVIDDGRHDYCRPLDARSLIGVLVGFAFGPDQRRRRHLLSEQRPHRDTRDVVRDRRGAPA